jgi:aspartate/methionine/tyrosine aminotransferase
MKLVKRMERIGTESAFEVLAKAQALEKQGRSIIHLEIGSPDFPTPKHVVEAGKKALDDGFTKYGPTAGLLDFREALAAHVSKTRGVKVGPDNICVVPGGKPIMFFVMMALLEEGDEVVYPDPSFPIYESLIHFLGAVPKPVPLVENRGFSFDLNVLRDQLSSKTKLVILNSPANPTGGVISKQDLKQIADLLRRRARIDNEL